MTAKKFVLGGAILALALEIGAPAVAANMPAATPAVAPANCALQEVASLPISVTSNGMLSVPVEVGNTPKQFVLVIAHPYSAVTVATANDQNLIVRAFGNGWNGNRLTYMGQVTMFKAYIPSLVVGHAAIQNVPAFLIQPVAPETGGVLGLDVLSAFDMELNLKAGKVNLFRPSNCPGQVVYWGRSYTVLPMLQDKEGDRYFTMELDGKTVRVALATLAQDAAMLGDPAKALFGITPPALEPDPQEPSLMERSRVFDGPVKLPVRTEKPDVHVFKSLNLNGLEIRNLHVAVFPDPHPQPCHGEQKPDGGGISMCWGGVDLTIGLHQLRQLRLYFAFKEMKLYVTAADPDPQGAVPTASGSARN